MKNKPAYTVTSVDHALQLATILQVEGPLTVTAAAERLGVARSTAHRLLTTLVHRDFAVQAGDRSYSAGPVLALGIHTQSRADQLRAAAMPHLFALVGRTGESANLTVLAGDRVRFVGSAESPQALRVGNREGTVFPAHLTSGGKAMLADHDDATIAEMYAPGRWVQRAETRPDVTELLRELEGVRCTGVAMNSASTQEGVTAIGVALRVAPGPAQAAVSVSLPTVRFGEAVLPSLIAAVQVAARDIEGEAYAGT